MSILKKLFILISLPICLFALYVITCIAYAKITYYNPDTIETIQQEKTKPLEQDSFSILIWNIGYAGLGAETDFFYDGGTMMRPEKAWSDKYLAGIEQTLSRHPQDFYLLQEVDQDARRSYHIDQTKKLFQFNPSLHPYFALNYKVNYIPMPWTNPMGSVAAGLLTASTYPAESSVRHQLPGAFGFPKQIFFLRRCLLVNEYPLSSGKKLIIVNLHNSAYDQSGILKKQENEYLKSQLQQWEQEGHYIVVGGDWNQCPPDFSALHFAKTPDVYSDTSHVDATLMKGWKHIYDPYHATNRKNDKPFNKQTTFTTIIDFFLVSPNIEVQEIKTLANDFAFSDHQPVTMRFKLK